jgi:signal transduction histidine kinase
VAFALAIGSFFASTVYSQRAARSIDEAAGSIVTNAVPSIDRLAGARTALIRLRSALRHSLFAAEKQSRNIEEARRMLDSQLSSYLALPFYGNEQALWQTVHDKLEELDRLVTVVESRQPQTFQTRLSFVLPVGDALDAVDDALRTLVAFNAAQAASQAARVTALRQRRARTELMLDALSALLTVTVALLAVRAMRQFAKILEQRSRLQTLRAEELEQFASRVAHDIRGPLTSTSMALQLCWSEAPSERAHVLLERGERGLTRVETIIGGLLQFARAGAQPELGVQTRVAPVIEEILTELQPLAAEQQIQLRADAIPDEAVACNAGVLSSVIENLVRNAIKYLGHAPVRSIVLRVTVRGERLRFEVENTGPGIAPDILPRIFQPYVRGRGEEPGIGLGLATVRRIVEAHGGNIRVQSSPRGSLFSFELPRKPATVHEEGSAGA